MGLEAFPLESIYLGSDPYGNPVFDKAVGALFYRNFWSKYFSDGVFAENSDSFKVVPHQGFEVKVFLGGCHIRGVTALPDSITEEIIKLSPSSNLYDRKDRLVIRADFEDARAVSIQVRENWKTGDALERTPDIWELAIAEITVRKGSASVTEVDIKDLRLDDTLCGVVTEPILRTNTGLFFTEIEALISSVGNTWESQKNSQQSAWLSQTNKQQGDFDALTGKIEDWYDKVHLKIALLQNFDFDNVSAYPGVVKETSFNGSVITETLKETATGALIAKRVTTISGSKIETILTLFDFDGISVAKEVKTVCQLGTNITETVTLQ